MCTTTQDTLKSFLRLEEGERERERVREEKERERGEKGERERGGGGRKGERERQRGERYYTVLYILILICYLHSLSRVALKIR